LVGYITTALLICPMASPLNLCSSDLPKRKLGDTESVDHNDPHGTTSKRHYHSASASSSSSRTSSQSSRTSPTDFNEDRCKYCGRRYCIDPERCRVAALVAKERKKQRTDPQLLCCDYNAVDLAIASGKPGRKEYDGAYLCRECLGAEIRNQFPKVNDWESQTLSEEDLWGKC